MADVDPTTPPEQAPAPAEKRYALVSPQGKRFSFPESGLGKALQLGFRPETADEYHERQIQTKYGDTGGQVKAGLYGAARGATLGLSDEVAVNLAEDPEAKREELRSLEEANPATSTVGNIAGAIGSSLLLPEASPMGLIGKAGHAVEHVASKALGGLATGAVGKTIAAWLSKGIGSAVEGAAMGEGQLVSEHALGEAELNAENVLAFGGMGGAAGGVLGGMLGALSEGVPAAARGVVGGARELGARAKAQYLGFAKSKAIAEADAALAAGSVNEAEHAATVEFAERAADPTGKGAEFREALLSNSPKSRDEMAGQLFNTVKSVDGAAESTMRKFYKARNVETGALLEGADRDAAFSAASDISDSGRSLLAKFKADPDLYPDRTFIRQLETSLEGYDKRVLSDTATAEDIFQAGNQLKRTIAANTKVYGDAARANPALSGLVGETKGFEKSVQQHLESPEIFGEAGSRQAAANAKIKRYIDARTDLYKKLGIGPKGGKELARSKFNTLMRQIGTEGSASDPALQEYLSAAQDVLPELSATGRNAGAALDAEGLGKSIEAASGARNKAFTAMKDLNLFNAMYPVGQGAAALQAAGGVIPGGGMVIKLVSRLKNALSFEGALRNVASVESMAGAGGIAEAGANIVEKAGEAAGSTIGGMGKVGVHAGVERAADFAGMFGGLMAVEKAARNVGRRVDTALQDFNGDGDQRQERPDLPFGETREARVKNFKQTLKGLADMASRPEASVNALARAVAPIQGGAPTVASHVQVKAATALQFLLSKAPKSRLSPNVLKPTDKYWEPSDLELDKFERYVRAVNDPVSVIEGLKRGDINREGVEALKVVYPRLYAQVQQKVTQMVLKRKADFPYEKRLALGILLAAPTDESLAPASIRTLQAAHSVQQPDAPGGGAVKPTATGLSKLNLAEKAQTPTERLLGARS